MLVAEQGLGDILQFIRFAPLVKQRGGHVVLACPLPMMRLVAHCPGVDLVVDWNSTLPNCDVHAYLMSLPLILGTTLDSIPREPYLSVDARTVDDWRPLVTRALGEGDECRLVGGKNTAHVFTIGIAWQGNRGNTVDRWRSFPLTNFAHLARLPEVCLVSLQIGDGTEQLAEMAGRFPVAELSQGNNGGEPRRDFLDTAAVISGPARPRGGTRIRSKRIWPGAWVAASGSPYRPLAIGVGCWNARTVPGIRRCGCSDRRSPPTGIPSFSEWRKRSRRCFRKSPWRTIGHRRYYAAFVSNGRSHCLAGSERRCLPRSGASKKIA